MRNIVLEFFRRGLVAAGFGPIILAVLYLILQQQEVLETLTVNEVCTGIISLFVLAFIAGGMNVIFQIERIPLMIAILIHGDVLYISYLVTYLINGWLEWGTTPILVFTGIFVVGYVVVWMVIYSITIKRTKQVNEILKMKQSEEAK